MCTKVTPSSQKDCPEEEIEQNIFAFEKAIRFTKSTLGFQLRYRLPYVSLCSIPGPLLRGASPLRGEKDDPTLEFHPLQE